MVTHSDVALSEFAGHQTEAFLGYWVFDPEQILGQQLAEAPVNLELARSRRRRICSVDKANVMESSQLWRHVAARTKKP